MKQIIAMHGWSGDSNSWDLWNRHFESNDWYWQNGERGYGGNLSKDPYWLTDTFFPPIARVVIGHSLGPHLLNKDVLHEATDVVLIASFGQFLPTNPANRALSVALSGMQKSFGTKEEKIMLDNFLSKACYPMPISAFPPGPIQTGLSLEGRKKLQSDLELLIQTKGLPKGLSPKSKVLVIDGEQDAIVIPSVQESLLQDLKKHLDTPPTHWRIHGAGHALLHPKLIKRVQLWLESPK